MREPIIYIRNHPDFVSDKYPDVLSPAVLEDLKSTATLSEAVAKDIAAEMQLVSGFLSSKAISLLLGKYLKDESVVESVNRVIRYLVPNDLKWVIKRLNAPDANVPDEIDIDQLMKILQILVQSYPAITRLRKAEDLAEITEKELESVDIVCDLRPVFDESRKDIEGFFPMTRLRIVASGANGFPEAFEVVLTRQQLLDLSDKVQKAQCKIQALCDHVSNSGGLPDMPFTSVKGTDGND